MRVSNQVMSGDRKLVKARFPQQWATGSPQKMGLRREAGESEALERAGGLGRGGWLF